MAAQAAALNYLSHGAGSTYAGKYYETSPRKVAIPAFTPPVTAPPEAVPVRRPAVRTAAQVRPVYRVSLLAIFGTMFVAALMLFVILAHISYIEITSDTVKLEAQLGALTAEGKKMEIAYEQTFDMDAIEAYATGVLGMVKLEAEQMVVVEATPRDKAVILSSEADGGGGGLGSFLSSLLTYLK